VTVVMSSFQHRISISYGGGSDDFEASGLKLHYRKAGNWMP
jgi:hypothetical protein